MKKIILVLVVSLSMNSCAITVIDGISKNKSESKKVFKDKIEVGDYFLMIPYENKNPYAKGDTIKVISKQGKYIQYQNLKYIRSTNKSLRESTKASLEEKYFRRAYTPIKSRK